MSEKSTAQQVTEFADETLANLKVGQIVTNARIEALCVDAKRAAARIEELKAKAAYDKDTLDAYRSQNIKQHARIEELEKEKKHLQELLHFGNLDRTMISVIGKAAEEKRAALGKET